jgi:Tol biopolymer transport system component
MSKKHIFAQIIIWFFLSISLFAQDEDSHAYLNWKQIETQHFFVNFHPGAERTAKIIAKIAEDIFPAITKIYNHEPDTKVSFIVKDFSDIANGATYFYDNKIEIWATSMDFDLRGTHNWLRDVISHEYTHMIQTQTSMKFGRRFPAVYFQWMNYEAERRPDVLYGFPNVLVSYPFPGLIIPAWFAEGVAQYNNPDLKYDFYDSHRDMIIRSYTLDNKMLSWEDMGVFGKTSLGNESSYNSGFSIVEYISETYGFDKVREISYQMGKTNRVTIDGAIEKALNKTGKELYQEWIEHLKQDYAERTEKVRKNIVDGEIIGKEGFGNLYPAFSPDGGKIAYTSNKKHDYFSLSAIYLYDMATQKEEEVTKPVRSELSFSPDGQKIVYSRFDEPNIKDEIYNDIYSYDLKNKKEDRLTFNKRGYSPAFSPDGSKIVFLVQVDGTVNLCVMDSDGKNIRQLTLFTQQEQIYGPKFSPDGKQIVFSYSVKDGRDIGVINSDGSGFKLILNADYDERNPVYSPDGENIVYCADRTGIFNIYRYNLKSGKTEQLTNVLGGAFMPAVNKNGDIAFADYTSSGYKLALIKSAKPVAGADFDYIKRESVKKTVPIDGEINKYSSLNIYDDTKVPDYKVDDYKSIFGSMLFIPYLKLDNYNKNNKGIDIFKPGIYFMSDEAIGKYRLFGGASINRQMERDLFLNFEYNDKLPGIYNLGLTPKITLELYNITRKTNVILDAKSYQIPDDVTYGMIEFDATASHKIFDSDGLIKLLYRISKYTASLGSFVFPEIQALVPASSDDYLLGYDMGVDFSYKKLLRSKTSEINPVGYKMRLKYDYEMNRLNSDGEYEVSDGGYLKPKYKNFDFSRVEFKSFVGVPLPGWTHTLSLELHGGSILGPEVNEFFNFYLGGFPGMKGYPFYAIGGNEFARANITYRFPISDDIDYRFAQIYFSKLYASFFFDFGNAWSNGTCLNSFKKDAGVELRLETFSWYAYPTRIFLSAAYGFDEFSRKFYEGTANEKTVTYGKEWRFYLGVLFGFEIFDFM